MPTDILKKHQGSSFQVAEENCRIHGHLLTIFAIKDGEKKQTILCSKCALSLEEIRSGEME